MASSFRHWTSASIARQKGGQKSMSAERAARQTTIGVMAQPLAACEAQLGWVYRDSPDPLLRDLNDEQH